MRFSIWSNSAAVSSMRVPIGARTCREIAPASTAGKKFSPRNGTRHEREQHEGQEADGETSAVLHRKAEIADDRQQRTFSNRFSKPCWNRTSGFLRMMALAGIMAARHRGVLAIAMRDQQIACHGRHQGARQDERADHGEHHRLGHRREQKAGNAGQKEHRHEGDADAEQRDERRHHDLLGAVQDRLRHRFCPFPDAS